MRALTAITFLIIALLTVLFAVPTAAKKADKGAARDWPCLGGTASRSNNYDGQLPSYPLKKKWAGPLGTEVDACVVTEGRSLVLGIDMPKRNTAVLEAIDKTSGDSKWRFERRVSRMTLYPVVSAGMAFIGCKNLGMNRSLLYCVSLSNGEKLWDYISQDDFAAPDRLAAPCILGDRIYVPAGGQLLCLAMKDGKLLWKSPIAFPNAPLAVDGVIYTGNEAIKADTGALIWKYSDTDTEADNPLTSPAFFQGRLFAGSAKGDRLVGLDAAKGTKLWQYRTEHSWRMVPAATTGMVIVTAERENKLLAFEPSSGDLLWETPGKFTGNPALAGENIYVPTEDGFILVIDPGNGEILFRANPGTEKTEKEREEGEELSKETSFRSTPLISDRLVFAASTDRLFCLEQKGRKPKRTFGYKTSSSQIRRGAISGTLYDKASRKPIAGAAVEIYLPFGLGDDGTIAPATLKAVTDAKGVFSTRAVTVEYTKPEGSGKKAKKVSQKIVKQVITISLKSYKTYPVERQLREGTNNVGKLELEKEQ